MAKKKGLGRGLDSLISGGVNSSPKKKAAPIKKAKKKIAPSKKTTKKVAKPKVATPKQKSPPPPTEAKRSEYQEVPTHKVVPSPYQPRRHFEEDAIKDLAESIRSEGLLQPIVVRQVKDEYQLIAGERRWRACQSLKLKTIPARLVEASESSSAVLSLIENLQRENLNPIEEALGYASLIRDFSLTQELVSERVGKGRASVANALRLLQLEKEIQSFLGRGLISVGHAKVLLGVEAGENRLLLARQSIERGWSVRELERQLNLRPGGNSGNRSGRSLPESEVTAVRDIEKQISTRLKTKVQLKHTAKKGKILIEYYGNDDLQRILENLGLN